MDDSYWLSLDFIGFYFCFALNFNYWIGWGKKLLDKLKNSELLLTYLAFLVFKIYILLVLNKMIDFKSENMSSESFYPDSNYYLDQNNTSEETPLVKDQVSISTKFEWPNSYWFIAERTNGRLAMIGFMAVIINYTLFGWIAYPIL